MATDVMRAICVQMSQSGRTRRFFDPVAGCATLIGRHRPANAFDAARSHRKGRVAPSLRMIALVRAARSIVSTISALATTFSTGSSKYR